MLSVKGTYENGEIKLDQEVKSKRKMKVIVTFLDQESSEKSGYLKSKDFSFSKAREASRYYKGSISDEVIEERREDV